MRQLLVNAPRRHGDAVVELAHKYDGKNVVQIDATSGEMADRGRPSEMGRAMVYVHVANGRVEGLLHDLQELPDVKITLVPSGVMALYPPYDEAPDQVTDVQMRSPIEVFLAGLQSIGSWNGFLGYAVAGGVVVWVGLYTNNIFLLIASMLISPFAGPAMNTALGTARGDGYLLRRSVLRYVVGLATTILVAFVLSFVLRQETATNQMIDASKISSIAVLLPLITGAAGALNLTQSERSSLVPGAATGALIAAALAPPAGIVGMALALGMWQMALSSLFVLGLQLVGINLAGAAVFRLNGVTLEESRYQRGRRWLFPTAMIASALALVGLLFIQFSGTPGLRRASLEQRATADIQQVVDESGLAYLVDTSVRFTRPDIPGQDTLLAVVYVQPQAGVDASDESIREQLTGEIEQSIQQQEYSVTPLVSVTVLEPPGR